MNVDDTHSVVHSAVDLMWRVPTSSDVSLLRRSRILVVEDDLIIALDMMQALDEAGAQVIGPATSVGTALALIARSGRLDGAMLDMRIKGAMASPVADELTRRGVPFLFTTACDASAIPARFAHVTRCEKPFDVQSVVPLLVAQRVRMGA